MRSLSRLLSPRSIAVVGGGFWGRNVLEELKKIGFAGDVWHVHPCEGYPDIAALPGVPDAAFVGVNREASIEVVRALSEGGAGGAVCFASGFAEAASEVDGAHDLQETLLHVAGDMPILGPNCYGVLNYLDRVALWPDQHGGVPVSRGVALITQSSNIAINLTMQARGLPIGAVVTVGNQAQQSLSDVGRALLADPRITALGLHVEGVGDPQALAVLAEKARALNKSVVILKVGASEQAQAATISHTASLAGSHAGARALFAHLGFAQVQTLEGLLDALKIAHVHGRLPDAQVASLSCSGGEASLMADLGQAHGVQFPPLRPDQEAALRAVLGPKVALANPLDYHTYIWGDVEAMSTTFTAMLTEDHALGLLVLDVPRADRCDPTAWDPAFEAVAVAQERSGRPMAVVSSLPETLPEAVAERLMARGVLAFSGLSAAFEAIMAMATQSGQPLLPAPSRSEGRARLIDEPTAKARLKACGVPVPKGRRIAVQDLKRGCIETTFEWPVVLKSVGAAHKSEMGGVVLNLQSFDVLRTAALKMPGPEIYVETMHFGAVAELLVGIVNDPAHGLVLTLGWGGTETELHQDVTQALLPVDATIVRGLLGDLRMAPLFHGYRGRPAADLEAVVSLVLALQDFVLSHSAILEVELNPVLCLPEGCVAVDALMREAEG